MSPLLVTFLLAGAYLVLLMFRFPHLIGWWNADSDIAAAYTIPDAVSGGHTGQVLMGTQGSWVLFWYGLLTHGLSFHRILWEVSAPLLTLATALLIGWSVARVASRTAAALTVVLIVAASPTGLRILTAPYLHNTTIAGVGVLNAYLVWLSSRRRTRTQLTLSIGLMSLITGTLLASDGLLAVVGLMPFVLAPLILAIRRRNPTGLLPVLAVTCGAAVVSAATSAAMRSFDFVAAPPSVGLTRTLIPVHIKWLEQALLRMGNGLSISSEASARVPLTVAAGVVTVCAIVGSLGLASRSVIHPAAGDIGRSRGLHTTFWVISLLCAATAYVVTDVALVPSDRYLITAVPAIAATIPLLLGGRRATWVIAAGASVFVLASIVSLAANDERAPNPPAVAQANRIEAVAQTLHLGVGYAGYWEAGSLMWTSHERLPVYPVTVYARMLEAKPGVARVQAWYEARPHTPSYLLVSSGDSDVPTSRLPPTLPAPVRRLRLGQITMLIYPYDIASYIHVPAT